MVINSLILALTPPLKVRKVPSGMELLFVNSSELLRRIGALTANGPSPSLVINAGVEEPLSSVKTLEPVRLTAILGAPNAGEPVARMPPSVRLVFNLTLTVTVVPPVWLRFSLLRVATAPAPSATTPSNQFVSTSQLMLVLADTATVPCHVPSVWAWTVASERLPMVAKTIMRER